jgi:hypothetical protein
VLIDNGRNINLLFASTLKMMGLDISKMLTPRANQDIFMWKPVDMPGVPKELIEHFLKVDPKAAPKKQRL